jgi:hypothetical protein
MERRGAVAALETEGSLASHDMPDLFQDLQQRRWSGALTLTHMGFGRSVTVSDGRMVFASSSNPDDRLGELLLRRGRIKLCQYVEAGRAIVPGKRLGAILVEQDVLSPKDLIRAVLEHTQEIIYGAFQWTEGRYRLAPGVQGPEAITLRMSTPDLIMEGIRRIESWDRIDRAVGGLQACYARAEGCEAILAGMQIEEEKLRLATFGGTRTVESLCNDSNLSDFEVCRSLWALRVVGVLRRTDAQAAAVAALADDEGLGAVLSGE